MPEAEIRNSVSQYIIRASTRVCTL